jgi:hypothetical protein
VIAIRLIRSDDRQAANLLRKARQEQKEAE